MFSGREADARAAIARALALNPNNPIAYHVQTFVNLFQPAPDTQEMEQAAAMALSLNPRDPLAWGSHFMRSIALWMRHGYRTCDDVMAPLAEACRLPQVDYFPLLFMAVLCIRRNAPDDARRYLDMALARRPDITRGQVGIRIPLSQMARDGRRGGSRDRNPGAHGPAGGVAPTGPAPGKKSHVPKDTWLLQLAGRDNRDGWPARWEDRGSDPQAGRLDAGLGAAECLIVGGDPADHGTDHRMRRRARDAAGTCGMGMDLGHG